MVDNNLFGPASEKSSRQYNCGAEPKKEAQAIIRMKITVYVTLETDHNAVLDVPHLADSESSTDCLSEENVRALHIATEAACGNTSFISVNQSGAIKLNISASEDEAFWQI